MEHNDHSTSTTATNQSMDAKRLNETANKTATPAAMAPAMESARNRSRLYAAIRRFFDERGYVEVETPTLSPDLIPEATIDDFATMFENEFAGSREMYLVPSPEVFMKRLIAQGSGSIYQISKCFRNCEQIGEIHNPEFTMLEYYTVDFDETDSISLTQRMIRDTALPGCPDSVLGDFEIISVRDAVMRYTADYYVSQTTQGDENGSAIEPTDIDKLQNPKDLRVQARRLGLYVPESESWDDTFNRIFINFVEPNLPKDHPICLTYYPRQIECLAERSGNYRRRWELYINGMEVANCYLEERNVETVRQYYREEYNKLVEARSQNGKVIPDADESFAEIFGTFPKCSGVAIGLDRLLMVETQQRNIEDVLLFPFPK